MSINIDNPSDPNAISESNVISYSGFSINTKYISSDEISGNTLTSFASNIEAMDITCSSVLVNDENVATQNDVSNEIADLSDNISNNYLKLSGGTISGDLSANNIIVNGNKIISSPQIIDLDIFAISTGFHSSFLVSSGNIYAFGRNNNGQLGLGNNTNKNTITKITTFYNSVTDYENQTNPISSDSINIVAISNAEHTLVLDSSGNIYAFGLNDKGQLGLGDTINKNTPTKITTFYNSVTDYENQTNPISSDSINIVAISTGYLTSLALDSNGNAYSFGNNYFGQLGLGNNTNINTPTKINISDISAISIAEESGLLLNSSGEVYSFGRNFYGELGLGNYTTKNTPTKITTLSNIVVISRGNDHSLVLDSNGDVYSFGRGHACGFGNTSNVLTPTKITTLSNIQSIQGGFLHSLVLDSNGDVYSFGYNYFGQLGLGNTTNVLTPTKITTLSNIVMISANSGDSNLILDSNGDVYSFGYNLYGQLGLGDNDETREIPTKITKVITYETPLKIYFDDLSYISIDGSVPNLSQAITDLSTNKFDKTGGSIDGEVSINGKLSLSNSLSYDNSISTEDISFIDSITTPSSYTISNESIHYTDNPNYIISSNVSQIPTLDISDNNQDANNVKIYQSKNSTILGIVRESNTTPRADKITMYIRAKDNGLNRGYFSNGQFGWYRRDANISLYFLDINDEEVSIPSQTTDGADYYNDFGTNRIRYIVIVVEPYTNDWVFVIRALEYSSNVDTTHNSTFKYYIQTTSARFISEDYADSNIDIVYNHNTGTMNDGWASKNQGSSITFRGVRAQNSNWGLTNDVKYGIIKGCKENSNNSLNSKLALHVFRDMYEIDNSIYTTNGQGIKQIEALTIRSTGNVGIGITEPQQTLHVRGSGIAITPENGTDNDEYWNIYTAAGNNEVDNLWFAKYVDGSRTQRVAYIEDDSGEPGHSIFTKLNFTGQHHNYSVNENIDADLKGFIVVSTGTYRNQMNHCNECNKYKVTINESLPIVDLSKKSNDKKVFGVISDKDDYGTSREYKVGAFVSVYEQHKLDRPLTINSLGEGAIWVCNVNGSIENGDYVTSSPIPGLGMLQNDIYLANFTVAKSTMDCEFSGEQVPRKKLRQTPVMIEKIESKLIQQTIQKQVPKLDESGNIIIDESGSPIMEGVFDESGNPIMEGVFDESGNPIMIEERDASGNVIKVNVYDESGNPVMVQDTYPNGELKYDPVVDNQGNFIYDFIYDDSGNQLYTDKYESKYVEVFSDKYVIYNNTEKTDEYYTYMFDFANGTTEQQSCIGNTYTMAFIGCTYHCG